MNQNTPIVILCGGYGTRISEETKIKPKPMVLIGNKPILSHIIGIYKYYGFKNFILAPKSEDRSPRYFIPIFFCL